MVERRKRRIPKNVTPRMVWEMFYANEDRIAENEKRAAENEKRAAESRAEWEKKLAEDEAAWKEKLAKDREAWEKKLADDKAKDEAAREKKREEDDRKRAADREAWEKKLADDKAKDEAAREKKREEDQAAWEKKRAEDWAAWEVKFEREKAEWNEKMGTINKNMGSVTKIFGEVIEHLVLSGAKEHFAEVGLDFTDMSPNRKITDRCGVIIAEIDLVLKNEDTMMIVETKSKPDEKDIRKQVEKMKKIRTWLAEETRNRRVLGAFAGAVFGESQKRAALKAGFFVIVQSGDTTRMDIPEGFVPRAW